MASLGPWDALLDLPVCHASLHLTSLYLRNWSTAVLHFPKRLNLISDRGRYFYPEGGEKSHWDWPVIFMLYLWRRYLLSQNTGSFSWGGGALPGVGALELGGCGGMRCKNKTAEASVHQGLKAGHLISDEIRTLFCLLNANIYNTFSTLNWSIFNTTAQIFLPLYFQLCVLSKAIGTSKSTIVAVMIIAFILYLAFTMVRILYTQCHSILFNLHDSLSRILLAPFYRWVNWNSGRLSSPELSSDRVGLISEKVWFQNQNA